MPSLPPTAKPARKVFDPWNSSSTGHQYAENRLSGSTSWRDSRNAKLTTQFGDQSRAGGERVYDTVGAGALGFGKDGRKEDGNWDETNARGARGKAGMRGGDVGRTGDLGAWLRGDTEGLRGGIVRELKREQMEHEGVTRAQDAKRRKLDGDEKAARRDDACQLPETGVVAKHWTEDILPLKDLPAELQRPTMAKTALVAREQHERAEAKMACSMAAKNSEPANDRKDSLFYSKKTTIFLNCNFYINGSTMPLISDHRLRFLITQHGGNMSIALGRKTVTHVILGMPNSKGGVGGGLASSKIQKEMDKIRGNGVKFIGVDWLLESIKAGKRLPEARFAGSSVKLAAPTVKSVYDVFKQTKPGSRQPGAGKGS